jgi:hypothetical protein
LNNLNHEYGVVAEKRNSVMLNKKVKVVAASSPLCSPNHYEVKSAPSNIENMKITHAEIFTSIAAIIPSPKEHQKVLPCTTRSHEKEQVVQSSRVADNEPHIDDIVNNISTGLSLMSQEVHRDGSIAIVKGQRSNIFQSECNIKDKVCKLIIDGGSFTNAISSDLVAALSFSTMRLPTPRYV